MHTTAEFSIITHVIVFLSISFVVSCVMVDGWWSGGIMAMLQCNISTDIHPVSSDLEMKSQMRKKTLQSLTMPKIIRTLFNIYIYFIVPLQIYSELFNSQFPSFSLRLLKWSHDWFLHQHA